MTEGLISVNDVKLFIFPDEPPLTKTQDSRLRLYYNQNFHTAIIKLLKQQVPDNKTVSYCSQPLSFPRILYVDKTKTLTDSKNPEKIQYALKNAISTKEQLRDFLKKSNIMDNPSVTEGKSYIMALDENDFNSIKIEFQECTNLQYFIPLTTFPIYNNFGHQNLLLFNKDDKRVTWIEPQYEDAKFEGDKILIKDIIIKLLKFLELNPSEYTLDLPSKQCPQSITLDDNCMFWTLMLSMFLMLNPKSTIDEVSSAILEKFPTKELLSKFIENFKVGAYNLMELEGGKRKRRRTIRRKPKNRKRTRKSI
jgi:hypothetical protein